jgi:hypothetical protein
MKLVPRGSRNSEPRGTKRTRNGDPAAMLYKLSSPGSEGNRTLRGGKFPAGEPGRATNPRDRKVPKRSKTGRANRSSGSGFGNGLWAIISPAPGNRK